MSGRKLLDSNHMSAASFVISPVRERLLSEAERGIVFGVCNPILCECEVGIRKARLQEECRREQRQLLKRVRIWPCEGDLPTYYADIYDDLKRRGRSRSQVDIMIAALCRQQGLTLLTADRDFEALPDIRVENWLA